MVTVKDYAEEYIRRGWQVVRLLPREKKPFDDGWDKREYTPGDFQDGYNIGVKLGVKSQNLVDVDIDDPEAVNFAGFFLPETQAIFGRDSKPGSHWLYICKDAKFLRLMHNSRVIVELRVNGQTMAPPSIHPSGEMVRWERKGAPAEVDYNTLERALKFMATATLIKPYWQRGSRQELTLHLAGGLLRLGLTKEEVIKLFNAIMLITGDEEREKRLDAIERTEERLLKDEPTTGFNRLLELGYLPADVVNTITRFFKVETQKLLEKTKEEEEEEDIRKYCAPVDVFLSMPFPNPGWLIEDILPDTGLTILAGKSKVGKSWLALLWNMLIATGESMLHFNPERAKVHYFALEDPNGNLQARLRNLANYLKIQLPGEYFYVTTLEHNFLQFDWEKRLLMLEKMILEIGSELITLDPWGLFAPSIGKNSDPYQEVYKTLFRLKEIAERLSVSFLLVHHVKKNTSLTADKLDTVLGSTAFVALADTIMILDRDRGAKMGKLTVTSRLFRERELGLRFRTEAIGEDEVSVWEFYGDWEDCKKSEERLEIIEALKVLGVAKPSQVADFLGKNRETVKSLMYKMLKKGEIEEVDRGFYKLPDRPWLFEFLEEDHE